MLLRLCLMLRLRLWRCGGAVAEGTIGSRCGALAEGAIRPRRGAVGERAAGRRRGAIAERTARRERRRPARLRTAQVGAARREHALREAAVAGRIVRPDI